MKPDITRGTKLKWSPTAWGKLIYFLYKGNTEVAGYAITGTEDPLYITDIKLVKQVCTSVTFELDEEDSNKFMQKMDDAGLDPWQYSNILWHTHPGDSPDPSNTDEKNFDKNFSHPNWAIFFIIARGGETYCRIRHNVGPGVECILKNEIDFSKEFPSLIFKELDEEYKRCVTKDNSFMKIGLSNKNHKSSIDHGPFKYDDISDYYDPVFDDYNYNEGIIEVDNEKLDDLTIDMDHQEITVWDDETNQYYIYLAREDIFVDLDAYDVEDRLIPYYKSPEPQWMNEVRQIAKKYFKMEEIIDES